MMQSTLRLTAPSYRQQLHGGAAGTVAFRQQNLQQRRSWRDTRQHSHRVPEMRPLQWVEDTRASGPGPYSSLQQRRHQQRQLRTLDGQPQQHFTAQQQQQQQSQQQQHQQQQRRPPAMVRRGLKPDHFRHPLDQQNTGLLRTLPGVELVAKTIMGACSSVLTCSCSVQLC